ncbi:LacI family transcriptional regulator [Puniceicoccaceae bacterium K14]|nr:LacI family transcriptional regulator [Puniceicoccaceae bacterium K14]
MSLPKNRVTQPPKRITLRDIADKLNVSHATVSLALRNHPRVSESVRDKIQKTAKKLGYTPDPMLSALAQYRLNNKENTTTHSLALINSYRNPQKIHDLQEFNLYFKGAKDTAGELGFKLEEFSITDLSLGRLDTILKTRNIRGLLLSPPDTSIDFQWEKFPWKDYATVRFGRSSECPRTHFVTSAQESNTIRAFDHIRNRGYNRIGFVTRYTRRRLFGSGFLWAQLELPAKQRLPILYIPRNATATQNSKSLDLWVQKNNPDAILSDEPELMKILNRIGYQVPEDIALATTSLHDTPIDTGIDQKPEEIGKAAARTLISMLHSQYFGLPATSNEILIEGQWKDGTTLPKQITTGRT